MTRSRLGTLALVAVAVAIGGLLVAGCSKPTAAPGGAAGTAPASGSGFDVPPGPVGVPQGGASQGYPGPGSSVEQIPTAPNPYPGPGATGAAEGEAGENEAGEAEATAAEGGEAGAPADSTEAAPEETGEAGAQTAPSATVSATPKD